MIDGLKPYPAMKNSGISWLGEVPEHWSIRRLCDSVDGCINGIWGQEADGEDGVACVRVADFDRRRLRVRIYNPTIRKVSSAERKGRLLQAGDLLLEKSGGGDRQPVGVVMLYDHHVDAVCSNFVARMPVRSGFDPRFLTYLHSHLYAIRLNVRSIKQTTGIQNLDSRSYLSEAVAYPPPDEQAAMVRFLDDADRRIRRYIRAKQKLIKLLEEQKQAIIHRAVTRGLDPDVPLKPSGVEWLGDVPEHWEVKRIKRVARMESGHTPSRGNPEHWRDDNDIPWVSLNDTKQLDRVDYISDTALHINELGLQNSSARILPAGVVVFTRDAAVGKAAITTRPMAVSQHLIAWVCNPEILNRYLLQVFYAMKVELSHFTFGATIATIGMDDVRKLVTPVPPVDEQKAISTYLEATCAHLAESMECIQRELKLLREYRTRLIADVVTGKLDVREAAARLPDEDAPRDIGSTPEEDLADDEDAEMEDDPDSTVEEIEA